MRTPLRPLARILPARLRGENTDRIEAENIRQRHEEMRDRMRVRAKSRLLFVGVLFLAGFSTVGVRMSVLASSEAVEPRASVSSAAIVAQRSNIVDRQGRVLATNLITNSLYAQPQLMIEPERAAKALVSIFPDLDEKRLLKDFTGERKFLWVKRKISPEQQQAVHEIGDPGLLFGPREMRLYPNGRLAPHILGGASFGREGVHSAEVIGTAGVERKFDAFLRDPALEGAPLRLSVDMTIQSAMRRVLNGSMKLLNAKAATAVLMKVDTGEVVSMVSLPDFDPNTRPREAYKGDPSESPLFNRSVQGVYELGSTFKVFAAAQALELGLVNPSTVLDTKGPMIWGKHKIRDLHDHGDTMSVTDVIVESSNIGTARMALNIGAERQQAFLKALGFFDSTEVELVEAPGAKPLLPKKWSELHTMTISYGHGIAASPLHLAAGYATMVGGGTLVKPTLLKVDEVTPGPRIISERTSAQIRDMLGQVVERGTASFAKDTGYRIGGKTGTADKPKRAGGGYYKDKVIATFASAFPIDDPEYVLVVTLDEPSENSGDKPRRTAGWTAVPVAAEIIQRTAPLLGLRPIEPAAPTGVTAVKFE